MKLVRYCLPWLLVFALAGCSGDEDNSEPPALLTEINDPLGLDLAWSFDTRASSNTAAYRLRPVRVDKTVYSIDTSGRISAINIEDGRRRWKFETGLATITGLGGDQRMLIAASQDGEVVAYRKLDKGLEQLWDVRIDSEVRAAPVLDGNQVFVRSVDGRLRALSAMDGTEQWSATRRVPVLSLTGNSEPLVDQQSVYAGFGDGKLIAFDRSNGQIRWESTISQPRGRTEVERLVDIDGNFVLSSGIIFVATFQGRLAAVQAVSGDILWSREFSSFQSIAIDDDAVYLSADNSDLWAVDRRTGSAFWKQDVLHARKITAPTIVGDKLVVGDYEGYLHWFSSKDGKLLGRIRTSEDRNYVQPLSWQQNVLTLDKLGILASVYQLP